MESTNCAKADVLCGSGSLVNVLKQNTKIERLRKSLKLRFKVNLAEELTELMRTKLREFTEHLRSCYYSYISPCIGSSSG